jgi:cation:H+ antiporter
MPEIIVFIVSLAATIRGADWVGRSAISFAKTRGIPQVVIGATLISIATTLPELTIATVSSIVNEDPQISLGVLLGSPLTNIGFILGLFFLFSRNHPQVGYFSRSINLFIVLSLLLLVVTFNQNIGGLISVLLIILGVLYLALEYLINKKIEPIEEKIETRFESFLSLFSFTKDKALYYEFTLGVIFLLIGSKYLTDTTIALASLFNVNDFLISITLLAIGTSLPELFTTINSLIYKRVSLSVGNLVGASVIDLTIGVGLGTVIHSGRIETPNNLIIFSALILVGIISLLSIWKKIPISLVGSLLLATALFFFLLFGLYNIL